MPLIRANSGETMGLFSRSANPAANPEPKPAETMTPRSREPESIETAEPVSNGNGADPTVPPEAEGEIKVEKVSEPSTDPAAPGSEAEEADGSDVQEADGGVVERAPENVVEVDADPDEGRMSATDIMAPTRRRGPEVSEPEAQRETARAKVISFANQKGGVAKTTTTLNLAVAFAESGHDVLCIDLDPQGNLTMSQGIDPDKVEKSMYDVLVDHIPLREIIQHREIDIAVASIDLAGAEIAMSTQIGRERSLEKAIEEVRDDYDFICIDTPPSLGLLTINALTASDKVIVPVQCEYLSMRGLVQLQNTLEMIQENLNPGVTIEGILPTMLDSRTVHAKEAVEILEENFGDLVFKSRIRKAVKFAEAPVRGASVLKYDPNGNAAGYYRDLAEEVLTHGASE